MKSPAYQAEEGVSARWLTWTVARISPFYAAELAYPTAAAPAVRPTIGREYAGITPSEHALATGPWLETSTSVSALRGAAPVPGPWSRAAVPAVIGIRRPSGRGATTSGSRARTRSFCGFGRGLGGPSVSQEATPTQEASVPRTTVTTGTSSGFGKLRVVRSAAEGWNVVATVRKDTNPTGCFAGPGWKTPPPWPFRLSLSKWTIRLSKSSALRMG
jgi:hypothetical protein